MEHFYVQIESYLLGELNGRELEAFENALRQDAALARAVEQHHTMQQRLRGLHLRKKVSAALQETENQTRRIPFRLWRVELAAAFVLLAIASWLFIDQRSKSARNQALVQAQQEIIATTDTQPVAKTPLPEEGLQQNPGNISPKEAPGAENLKRYKTLAQTFYVAPTTDFVRSANEMPAEQTRLQAAIKAFDQKKYRLAADLLNNDASLGADDSGRFLRAHARFNSGRFAAAAADFNLLENSFQYKYEARWNGLLCRIAQGKAQDRETQALLDAMASDADFPFQEQAIALSKRL